MPHSVSLQHLIDSALRTIATEQEGLSALGEALKGELGQRFSDAIGAILKSSGLPLLEARIRIPGGVEVTVNEVLREAAGRKNDGLQLGVVSADALLQRYGMRLTADNAQLLISNSSRAIKDELLVGTQYAADPRGMLLRLPGAARYPHPVRFNGVQARCISLPTKPILSDDIIVAS